MINRIKKFLLGDSSSTIEVWDQNEDQTLRVSTVALLIQAAVMDGHFDAAERKTITDLLIEGFELTPAEAHDLVEAGSKAIDNSVDLFSFARILKGGFSEEQRLQVVEMLWRVSLADGVIHDYEANLIRCVCGLLHVDDQDSGKARKRVLESLDKRA